MNHRFEPRLPQAEAPTRRLAWCRRRFAAVVVLALGFAPLTAAAASDSVSITLTEHGIPHIRAADFRGLGYGYGYAMARNDACGMADMFLTFSGSRAAVLGEQNSDLIRLLGRRPLNNAINDFTRRFLADAGRVRAAKAALSDDLQGLLDGYVGGYNRYVHETPITQLPSACRTSGSVRPIGESDVLRRIAGASMLLSSGLLLEEIYAAAPPALKAARTASAPATPPAPTMSGAGSNAYAFGREATADGSGLLLGNPHFFWDGPDRFVELHLTIPGAYDAMGVTLQGLPLVLLGFNQSLAWSHTVSTDKRGVIYQLKLDPRDPTRYLVDGHSLPMTRTRVTITVTTAGHRRVARHHDFWQTRYGPVLGGSGLPWTRETAFALMDPNRDNYRLLEQWLEIGRSRDVAELKAHLETTVGLPWVNTIAVDRAGTAFYADISVAPNLDAATLQRCQRPFDSPLASLLTLLEGSDSTCAPAVDPAAPQPGIMRGSAKPSTARLDFVENSNDSYWLVNPAVRLENFSPIVGPERSARNFRTRQGMLQVADRLGGRDGLPGNRMSAAALEQILMSGRSMQAELVVDALLDWCRTQHGDPEAQRLARACDALRGWDRHYGADSRGAHLFAEFAAGAGTPGAEDLATTAALWSVPFDPADPVNTPRGFRADDPRVRDALLSAVARIEGAGLALDAALRDVQFVQRRGERIPMSGGPTFSRMHLTLQPRVGYTEPFGPSNSYIQVVGFDASGPVADAILGSSQTPDDASPFYMDQTLLFGRGEWVRLPFTEAAIAAARVGNPTELSIPAQRPAAKR
jgi:acyl-homoserine-lactone acylase